MTGPASGWYRNPRDTDDIERWWNGAAWTSRTRTAAAHRPAPEPATEPAAEPVGGEDTTEVEPAGGHDPTEAYLDDIFSPREELEEPRPRRLARVGTPIAILLIAVVALAAFRYLDLRERTRSERNPSTTTMTSGLQSTTTVEPAIETTTTLAPPPTGPFDSEHGWRFTPAEDWVARERSPDDQQVYWMTPSGAIVEVTSVANPAGQVVNPTSIHEGIDAYVAEYFGFDGPVEVTDETLGGSWAVRADASDELRRVVIVTGSPDRRTTIISIDGTPAEVEASIATFDAAVASFSYT